MKNTKGKRKEIQMYIPRIFIRESTYSVIFGVTWGNMEKNGSVAKDFPTSMLYERLEERINECLKELAKGALITPTQRDETKP